MHKYFGQWSGRADIVRDFSAADGDVTSEESILFATYDYIDYDGSATVWFEREGQLFEVSGSHCSCYGLEGQWEPGVVTWEALAMRPNVAGYGQSGEAEAFARSLVKERSAKVRAAQATDDGVRTTFTVEETP